MNLAVVYGYIRDRDDNLSAQVRALYEEGLPTRAIAVRLRIGLDEARQCLRRAYPDNRERGASP